ncbi:MAG: eukaryotic-like serine/threonine-protein kinase [Pseudonocardiales bacterium]|jgi:serine/threonine protein kinase|nr:eukaryotic-like serine/threonine-protein kinase [Pseudonocardiales bacterium]
MVDLAPPSGSPLPCPALPLLAGRYRLGALLGRGGMADVLEAWDELTGRKVAVKLFRPDVATADGDLRRGNEARLLEGLEHPNLVRVLDAGVDDTHPADPRAYLALELVDGPTLAARIARGPLPERLVRGIGGQLASALAYVHSGGIVHRDVKPANILLGRYPTLGDPDGAVAKLTDFGIAHVLDATRMTEHGSTSGTANYLSPEQVRSNTFTAASDVYSLGLVLLESLTGVRAYPGLGIEAAVARLYTPPVVPDSLGPAWQALLVAMTADQPVRRPTAEAVASWIAGLDDTASFELADPVTSSAPRTKRRRRPRTGVLAAAGAAVVCAAAALAVLGATSGSADSRTPTVVPVRSTARSAGVAHPAVGTAGGTAVQPAVGTRPAPPPTASAAPSAPSGAKATSGAKAPRPAQRAVQPGPTGTHGKHGKH